MVPHWPAPPQVRAASTTRLGGVSSGPYAGLNLGDHVGDVPAAVAANRAALARWLELPAQPFWLRQVHGTRVVAAARVSVPVEADASLAQGPGAVCAVMTADCLPVLFCDRAGHCVAAAHAGWRGLAAGVLEATVDALPAPAPQLMAWLGPAIGPRRFEVGAELRALFVDQDPANAAAFAPGGGGDGWRTCIAWRRIGYAQRGSPSSTAAGCAPIPTRSVSTPTAATGPRAAWPA
jgi:hypothetical protein